MCRLHNIEWWMMNKKEFGRRRSWPNWEDILAFVWRDPKVPGSIFRTSGFSEKQWVWNGVHSSSWGQLRSYSKEKVAAPVKKTKINDRGNPLRWPRNILYPQKLALLSQQAAVAPSVHFARGPKPLSLVLVFSLYGETEQTTKVARSGIEPGVSRTCQKRQQWSRCAVSSATRHVTTRRRHVEVMHAIIKF
jgi:hypothetical protein